MGAKQSKRSVDITTTPKKGDVETAAAGETEGKVEKIEDVDVKTTNGGVNHADIEYADHVENEVKDKGDAATAQEDSKQTSTIDSEAPVADVDDAQNEKSPESIVEVTPDKEKKKKEKKSLPLKIWASFSKKDKSKPTKSEKMKEEAPESTVSPTVEECQSPKAEEEVKKAEENVEPQTTENNEAVHETTTEEEVKPEVRVEVKCDIPVLEVIEEKSTKEETADEVPPPLPTTNPPSEVIEEAPKAEPEPEPVEETVAIPSNEEPEAEPVESKPVEIENIVSPNKEEVVEDEEEEEEEEMKEVEVEDVATLPQLLSDVVGNSDSIPDISTESLPSLPEPLSETTLPEPTSLPPLDAVPQPITELEEKVSENGDVDAAVLTNGNTNGHLSPGSHMNGDDDAEQFIEEPVKHIKASVDLIDDSVEETCETKKAENTSEPITATCEE